MHGSLAAAFAVPRVWGAAIFGIGLVLVGPAMAQEVSPGPAEVVTATVAPPGRTEAQALRLARAAFEYRDFARVLAILEPWLRPPRIADAIARRDANRFAGIAAHVLGEVRRAEDAFAQALLADPGLELDPFVVPPPVIETFERVRASMAAVLRPIERPRPSPPASLGPRVLAYAPLGLGHFTTLDEPEWGAVWLGLEVTGLVASTIAYWVGVSLGGSDGFLNPLDRPALDRAHTVQIGGLALFGAAWIASAIQGDRLWVQRRDELATPP